MNRVYPGRADGTLSERIAFAITSQVIAPATHLVDLHSGEVLYVLGTPPITEGEPLAFVGHETEDEPKP